MEIEIVQLERALPNGVVTTAHWTATKQQEGFTASSYGAVALDEPDADIIPFEDLTKEQVQTWVESKLDLPSIEASLDAQLDTQINPPIATGLPWLS